MYHILLIEHNPVNSIQEAEESIIYEGDSHKSALEEFEKVKPKSRTECSDTGTTLFYYVLRGDNIKEVLSSYDDALNNKINCQEQDWYSDQII